MSVASVYALKQVSANSDSKTLKRKISLRKRITFQDLEVNAEAKKFYDGVTFELFPDTPLYVDKSEPDADSPIEFNINYSF